MSGISCMIINHSFTFSYGISCTHLQLKEAIYIKCKQIVLRSLTHSTFHSFTKMCCCWCFERELVLVDGNLESFNFFLHTHSFTCHIAAYKKLAIHVSQLFCSVIFLNSSYFLTKDYNSNAINIFYNHNFFTIILILCVRKTLNHD